MNFNIDWSNNNVLITYSGVVGISDLFKISVKITNDPRYASLQSVISDFVRVTILNISDKDIKEMSTLHVIPSILNPNLKFAIISNRAEFQESIFNYIDLMKVNEWQIKLFEHLDESREWINQGEIFSSKKQ